MVFWQGNHQIYGHTVYIWYFWQGNHQIYGHTVYIYDIFGREITIHSVIYSADIWYFWQGNHQTYGHVQCIYTVFLAGKSPYIRSYTVYIWYFWQGNHQTYGHIRCIYTVFLAGKSPNIRSYTVYIYGIFGREITICSVIYGVYIRYFWQGNHQTYGHIRCIFTVLLAEKSPYVRSYTVYIYGIFGREITKHTVMYGVHTVLLAGKSPYVRSYPVQIHSSCQPYLWPSILICSFCMALQSTSEPDQPPLLLH